MAKKVGTLIKEARTNAGMTQAELAKKVTGITAQDISKAERGEKELSSEQLKAIAKATGVTQKSLLDAVSASGKTTSGSSSGSSIKLSTSEKKLVNLYRKADNDTKEAVMKLLEKEEDEPSIGTALLQSLTGGGSSNLLNSLLGSALGALTGSDKKEN